METGENTPGKENSSPQLSSQLSKCGPQVALPLPHVKASRLLQWRGSRMAALAINKPEAGLDSGQSGSWGTAVVKVRDFASLSPPPASLQFIPKIWLFGRVAWTPVPLGLTSFCFLRTFIPAGLRLPGLLFILVLCSHQRAI